MITKTLHLPHDGIDEALWAAYRSEDKSAVMGHLFRRILVRISRSTSFPQIVVRGGPARGSAVNRVRSPALKDSSASVLAR
jgi:hypothetical protein